MKIETTERISAVAARTHEQYNGCGGETSVHGFHWVSLIDLWCLSSYLS